MSHSRRTLVSVPLLVPGSKNVVIELEGGKGAIGEAIVLESMVSPETSSRIFKLVAITTQTGVSEPPVVFGVVRSLKLVRGSGGAAVEVDNSPNLFEVNGDDWLMMQDFDVRREKYASLRAYPYIIAPNVIQVTIAAFATAGQKMQAAVSAVFEDLGAATGSVTSA